MNLSEEQLLTLAPDEASKKSGKDLAAPAKWVTKGANETALWGECQGSGSKPYQTVVDLANTAFKCSCPSRKFPCKHGIGLGLLYARQQALFVDTEAPAWAAEWLSKRAQKEEKKTEKVEKPVDEAAQAKRQQARESKVENGVAELLLWIKDLVRNGIISAPEKGYPIWEGMTKRMVDAQAPGLAGMIKTLGNTPFYKEGWQSGFLDNLLNLYLVAKGYQNKAPLDTDALSDIRAWIGFTVDQQELKEQQGVMDTWLVLGKQVTEDDGLTVERHWLYGLTTNRYALYLQFIIRGQGATVLLSPGMYVQAELVFYPSSAPLRVFIKRQMATTASHPQHAYLHWQGVAEAETALCAAFPVRSERPYIIKSLLPVRHNKGWWLLDEQENVMMIKEGFTGIWKLLALSGGEPSDLAVVGKERRYEPIGVWHNKTYKAM